MRRLITLFLVAGSMAAAFGHVSSVSAEESTQVYRSTDEAGHPVFSDHSSSDATVIDVPAPITYPTEAIQRATGDLNYDEVQSDTDPESQSAEAVDYSKLQITSPVDKQTIRNNAGNITVEVLAPQAISPDHQVNLLMDGVVVANYRGSPLALQHVDRGTHQLQLEIINTESGESYASSPPVVFTLQRHSILHKPRK
jgi:hypothetical protein